MLAATTHIGSENSETTMEQYIFKRRADGVHIINIKKTWEKLLLGKLNYKANQGLNGAR